jgi:hypothetical protein
MMYLVLEICISGRTEYYVYGNNNGKCTSILREYSNTTKNSYMRGFFDKGNILISRDINYTHPLQQCNTPNGSMDAHSQKKEKKLRK